MGQELVPIFQRIVQALQVIGGALALCCFAWAGILLMASQGDPAGVAKSKSAAFYAAVGLAVVLSAGVIGGIVTRVVQG